MATGCRLAFSVLASGAGVRVSSNAPNGVFTRFINNTNGQVTTRWSPLTAVDTGRGTWTGYLPTGAQLGVDGPNIWAINLKDIAAPGTHNMYYFGALSELAGTMFSSAAPQNPTLAPLEPSKLAAVTNAFAELAKRLRAGNISKACKEKVIDKLNSIPGFSIDKFADFLAQGGEFYDGTRSTAKNGDYNGPHFPDQTIASTFATSQPRYDSITSANPNTGFVVFYRPNAIDRNHNGINPGNLSLQFHEGLHGFGNANGLLGTGQAPGRLTDPGLQMLFFGKTSTDTTNISQYLRENCF
jgi:hypothetical protein